VRWAKQVPDEFHARFSALARRYRYTIVNRAVRPALEGRYVTWERARLDVDRMRDAAQALIGEHDFNAFRSIACQANTSMRNVHDITLERVRDRIDIQIQANAFLHHMVRNIVGSLLPIGRGERPVEWMAELLEGKDRTRAGATAPATGLTFLFPLYPDRFGLPEEVTLR
jgi:tRNA pseudouridine38-40 synthase